MGELAAAALLFGGAAAGQQEIWRNVGESRGDAIGQTVAWLGDVDGDGVFDFATTAGAIEHGMPYRVLIVAGASGATLVELDGDPGDSRFGPGLVALGDVDRDGVGDLAIPGAVIMWYSGRGAPLRTITSEYSGSGGGLERTISSLPDLDGDGIREFAYVDVDSPGGYFADEHLRIVSGADGTLVREHLFHFDWTDPWNTEGLGSIGSMDDTDGDGVGEYSIGRWASSGTGYGTSSSEWAEIRSGADGRLRYTSVGGLPVTVGDVDGDARFDFVSSDSGSWPYYEGHTWLMAGADGSVIRELLPYGAALAKGPDIDGDGIRELLSPNVPDAFGVLKVEARSAIDGTLVGSYRIGTHFVASLDASVDLDEDGIDDLLAGIPSDGPSGRRGAGGVVAAVSGLAGAELLSVVGEGRTSEYGAGLTLVSDRDGDGARDLAIAVPGALGPGASFVQIASSRDGGELARSEPQGGIASSGQVAGLGDLDGDGIDELALVRSDWTIELRAGSDGSLLSSFALSAGVPVSMCAADESNGHVLLGVATSISDIRLYDLTAGGAPRIVTGRGATGLSCMGDVNGDGSVDWVVCDPTKRSGRNVVGMVSMVSGATGKVIWTLDGTTSDPLLGVHRAASLNGDAFDDAVVYSSGGGFGKLAARDGRSGTKLFELSGPTTVGSWGTTFAALGDVNGDGVSDFAIGAPTRDRTGPFLNDVGAIEIWSGATATLLRRIDGDREEEHLGAHFPTLRRGQELAGDGPGLFSSSPDYDRAGRYRGFVDAYRLSDLFLQITPPRAGPDVLVTADSRGGPANSAAGLYVVSIDGAPLDEFAAFGTLDALGEWTTSDTVPPGLAGRSYVFRSYCVGFDGRLARSTDETLDLE